MFAKENVEFVIEYLEQEEDNHLDEGDIQVFRLAINVLKRQIPKLPEYTYDEDYICPTCHEGIKGLSKYCGECGQKLNWED